MASEFLTAAKNIGIGTLAAVAARAAFAVADKVGAALGGPRSQPHPYLGGMSLREAQENAVNAIAYKLVKRKYFNVTVADYSELETVSVSGVEGQAVLLPRVVVTPYSEPLHFLALEVNYSDQQVTGDKRRIGGAQSDSVTSREPVEVQIVTYDKPDGVIKKAMRAKSKGAVHPDGTVGVPADYAVVVVIEHAFVKSDDVEPNEVPEEGAEPRRSYVDRYLMRIAGVDFGGLSRRDDGLQEITITFQQLDTFMGVP